MEKQSTATKVTTKPVKRARGKRSKGSKRKQNAQPTRRANVTKPKIKNNNAKILGKKKSQAYLKQLFLTNVEKPALTPIEQYCQLNYDSLANFIGVLASHVSMKTSLFVIEDPNQFNSVYPGEFAMYCYLAACYHINKHGQLSQQGDTLPLKMDWVIPFPLAKWLQGLSTYTEHGFALKTKFDIDFTLSVGRNYPDTSANTLQPPSYWSVTNSILRSVRSMLLQPNGNGWEYFLQADGVTVDTISTFILNRAPVISQRIATCNMSTMLLDAVPEFAPCGSAYAIPTGSLTTTGLFNCWNSIVCSCTNDVAMLYGGSKTTASAGNPDFVAPNGYCVPYYANSGYGANEYVPDMFLNTFVLCWMYMMKYKKGPILRTTSYCKLKITTLVYRPIKIDMSVPARIWGAAYANIVIAQMNSGVANNPLYTGPARQGDANYANMSCGIAVAQMIALRRYNVSAVCYDYYDNKSCPQQYYASEFWSSIPMPAVFNAAVMDLGPVVHCGMLYAPSLTPLNYGSSNNVTQTPYVSLKGFGSVQNPPGQFSVFGQPFWGNVATDTSLSPFLKLDNFVVSTANVAPFQISITGSGVSAPASVYGVNFYSRALLENFNQIWSRFNSGPNYLSQLVHPHQSICGSTLAMLGTWFYNNASAEDLYESEYLIPQGVFAQAGNSGSNTTYLMCQSRKFGNLFSNVQVSTGQMTRAMIAPWSVTTNPVATYKFGLRLDSPISIFGFAKEALTETCVPESAFGMAIAAREKTISETERSLSVGSLELMINVTKPECSWEKIFNEAIRALNPLLRKGAGFAGMYACGGNIACAPVAELMYDWLASNFDTEANDITKPVAAKSSNAKKVDEVINKIIEVIG